MRITRVLLSRPSLGGVVLALALTGCGPPGAPARNADAKPTTITRQNEKNAAEVAFATATKVAADLSLRSTPDDLEDARQSLFRVQKSPSTTDAQAPFVAALIERLDAALAYRAIHERWAAALTQENHGKEVADAKLSAFRTAFRGANPDFRKLDDALLAAERRFVQATNRLRGVSLP